MMNITANVADDLYCVCRTTATCCSVHSGHSCSPSRLSQNEQVPAVSMVHATLPRSASLSGTLTISADTNTLTMNIAPVVETARKGEIC